MAEIRNISRYWNLKKPENQTKKIRFVKNMMQ